MDKKVLIVEVIENIFKEIQVKTDELNTLDCENKLSKEREIELRYKICGMRNTITLLRDVYDL